MADLNQQLAAIPFGALIGGPLNAAVEAQAKAARTSYDFIKNVGFEVDNAGNIGAVRMVSFTYEAGGVETTLKVPLLTVLPIPFLRIEDMTIDFKASMSVSTSTEDKTSDSINKSISASVGGRYMFVKAEMSASYSSKKDSSSTRDSKYSVEYTMDVHVHAVQDDVPAGLSKVLGLLVENINNAGQGGGAGKGGGGRVADR